MGQRGLLLFESLPMSHLKSNRAEIWSACAHNVHLEPVEIKKTIGFSFKILCKFLWEMAVSHTFLAKKN